MALDDAVGGERRNEQEMMDAAAHRLSKDPTATFGFDLGSRSLLRRRHHSNVDERVGAFEVPPEARVAGMRDGPVELRARHRRRNRIESDDAPHLATGNEPRHDERTELTGSARYDDDHA